MKIKNELYIIIAAALWGTISIFKNILSDLNLSEITLVFIRSFVSTIMFGIYLLIKSPSLFKVKIKDLWCFFGTGVISLLFFSWCYFNAMKLTSVSVAVTLLYTSPVFVTVMSVIFFKESLTRKKIISLLLALFGCMLVTGVLSSDSHSLGAVGIVFGILSGFAYALYSIFGKFAINKGYSSETITFYTFLFSLIFSAPFCNFADIKNVAFDSSFIIGSFGLGVLCCILPYILYTKGLERISGSKASVLAIIEPVVGAIIGMTVFSEHVYFIKIVGIFLVLASTVILSKE